MKIMKSPLFLVGFTFLFIGSMLLGLIHYWLAKYIPTMQEQWISTLKNLSLALNDIGATIPYFLSLFLIVVGICMLFLYVIFSLRGTSNKTPIR